MKSHEALEFWYAALRADIGVVIDTDNVSRLQQKLYIARREAQDPSLEGLSIVISPTSPSTQLWIVKRDAADSGNGTPPEAHPLTL